MQMRYPIVLKFGTQQDTVSAHCGIKFGCNTVNGLIKTNTNMLSRLQGKLLIARNWKLAEIR